MKFLQKKRRQSWKHLFLLAFTLTLSNNLLFSQFFEDKFDAHDVLLDNAVGGGTGNGYSTRLHKNANYLFVDGAGPVMRSYIRMYEVTLDEDYLDKFIIHSKNIQDRRDDEPNVNSDIDAGYNINKEGFTVEINTYRPFSPTWSQLVYDAITVDDIIVGYNYNWLSTCHNAGGITYGMAQFIYLVKVEKPSLASNILPTLPSTDPSNVLSVTTYGEYADWLLNRILETVEYYDNPTVHDGAIYKATKWQTPIFVNFGGAPFVINSDVDPLGYFLYKPGGWYAGNWNDPSADSFHPNDWNQQHLLACTLVLLGETLKTTNPADPRIGYMWMKQAMLARNFKEEGLMAVGNHYEWAFKDGDTEPEDVSHGSISALFPLFCYKYNLENSNGDKLFEALEVEKMTRAITESSYHEPMRIFNSLNGTDYFYRTDPDNIVNDFRESLSRWLPFTEYQFNSILPDYTAQDLYQITSEIYFDDYIINAENFEINAEYQLGLANLAFYQKLLNPIGANRMPGDNIAWAGVSGGDFDNDGVDEFISVSNFEGNFYMYEYNESHLYDITTVVKNANPRHYEYQIDHVSSETSPGSASDWVDVVAGDFSTTHPGDEFVAARNVDGKFYMYELNAGDIVGTASYLMEPGKTWVGLASGDFDGDGTVEFAAIQDVSNKLYIFELSGGTISPDAGVLNNGFYLGAGSWRGLASGDFNADGNEELVTANNTSGDLVIFKVVSGNIVLMATESAPGSASDWRDLTGGDFDGDGVDEFLAYRNYDGAILVYEMDEFGSIVYIGSEQFTAGQQMTVWGSGNFVPSLTNTREEIIALRNHDGDQLMYSMEGLCRTGHPCPVGLNGNPPQKMQTIDSNEDDEGDVIDFKIYPNPTSGETNIQYHLVEGSNVVIEVYNQLGQKIKTLINQNIEVSGYQNITLESGLLPPGVYNVLIRINENSSSQHLVIN